MPRRKTTQTSSFGSPGRIGHDASAFYAGKIYQGLVNDQDIDYVENPIPAEKLDRIFYKSAEDMSDLPDNSIHLMVTSPPYNVGKDYDIDQTLTEYLDFIKQVWEQVGGYASMLPTWDGSLIFLCMPCSSQVCWN
jgi:hypothetical protein